MHLVQTYFTHSISSLKLMSKSLEALFRSRISAISPNETPAIDCCHLKINHSIKKLLKNWDFFAEKKFLWGKNILRLKSSKNPFGISVNWYLQFMNSSNFSS